MNDQTAEAVDQLKRPAISGYARFCSKNRPSVTEQLGSSKQGQIMKALADMWKELPQVKKDKFNERAKRDLDAFKAENPDFKAAPSKKKQKKLAAAEAVTAAEGDAETRLPPVESAKQAKLRLYAEIEAEKAEEAAKAAATAAEPLPTVPKVKALVPKVKEFKVPGAASELPVPKLAEPSGVAAPVVAAAVALKPKKTPSVQKMASTEALLAELQRRASDQVNLANITTDVILEELRWRAVPTM